MNLDPRFRSLGSGRPSTGGPIVRSGAHDPGLFYSPRQGCAAVATIAIHLGVTISLVALTPRGPCRHIVRCAVWHDRCVDLMLAW
jgi:hypothetical protein